MILMVKNYGAVGGPIVWILLNAGYLIIMIPLMHRRLLTSEMKQWYLLDSGVPIVIIAGTVLFARFLLPDDASKFMMLLWAVFTPLIAFMVAFLTIPTTRAWIDWAKLRKVGFSLK